MDDVPPRSYGPLIDTTLRIVTWNVWGLYGPWPQREAAIVATLHDARPDIVVLTESWAKGGDSQCARLAAPLGLPHHAFTGVAAQEDEAALSGVAVLSRWPIQRQSSLTLGCARVQFAEVLCAAGLGALRCRFGCAVPSLSHRRAMRAGLADPGRLHDGPVTCSRDRVAARDESR